MAELAKVFVWKDEEDVHMPWCVGTEDAPGVVTLRKNFETYQDAWQWLEENYVREVS